MSIKTIDTPTTSNVGGVAKKIHKGAERMVFDILQATQYSNPIPSTIRELTTNACDSQREKEIAIEILNGEKTAKDYYIERGGDQYEDSNFDKSYYNLSWLNKDKNKIEIVYTENAGIGYCDTVCVTDWGVGLRADRLEGILQLGFSTKRNTSQSFGAFGLGAKVALSTGVEFYSIETAHNGKKFKCDCYPYDTKFKYPSFNPHVVFKDGSKVHYEETGSLNYTKVTFNVKKHNRRRYVHAVEEQLTYISNVVFKVIDEDSYERTNHFHPEILHNSDTLIVSSSYVHSTPHIVIVKDKESSTGINYGAIDFKELEMERMWGSVGLKCPARQVIINEFGKEQVLQEGVDVTPSREKVIWNERTKEFILTMLDKAIVEAETIVETALKENDLIKWVTKCKTVLSLARSEQMDENVSIVLGQLSRITDMSSVKPKFPLETSISYKSPSEFFTGFKIVRVFPKLTLSSDKTVGSRSIVFIGSTVENWNDITLTDPFYFQEIGTRASLKDYYILEDDIASQENVDSPSYIYIKPANLEKLESQISSIIGTSPKKVLLQKKLDNVKKAYSTMLPHLKAAEQYRDYTDISIPEGFEEKFKEYKTKEIIKKANAVLSPKELRKQNSLVLVNSYISGKLRPMEESSWGKVEPSWAVLSSPSMPLYYGTIEDGDELVVASSIVLSQRRHTCLVQKYSDFNSVHSTYIDAIPKNCKHSQSHRRNTEEGVPIKMHNQTDTVQVIRVSKAVEKQLAGVPGCQHISNFFLEVTDSGEYTVPAIAKRWWNMYDKTYTDSWLFLYSRISPEYDVFFKTLKDYGNNNGQSIRVTSNFSMSSKEQNVSNTIEYYRSLYTNMAIFEKYVVSVKDFPNSEEKIKKMSAELFVLQDISGAKIIDPLLQKHFEVRDELSSTVDSFMPHLYENGNKDSYSSPEFITELKLYLQLHGKLDIKLPQLPLTK